MTRQVFVIVTRLAYVFEVIPAEQDQRVVYILLRDPLFVMDDISEPFTAALTHPAVYVRPPPDKAFAALPPHLALIKGFCKIFCHISPFHEKRRPQPSNFVLVLKTEEV